MSRAPGAIVADAEAAARHAKAALESIGVRQAFAKVEADLLAQIRGSDPATGRDEREAAFFGISALDALRSALEATASGAAIAQQNHRFALKRRSKI